MSSTHVDLQQRLTSADATDPEYASRQVDVLLSAAQETGASDVHLQPAADGLRIDWRIDGVLQPLVTLNAAESANMVARLKVLAELLTYQSDVPQEGRIRDDDSPVEMRVSTFPTLHGERAVVRIFAAHDQPYARLADLGLRAEDRATLEQMLAETTGALVVAGPAGCGKTTTAYACLREELADTHRGRSVVTLEDPIEVAVEGISQSQVSEGGGFDMATGLRSLMRQDPDVILVGEIRDAATASIAFQAALTGQLVITTFHAPSAAGAVSRLLDMGIEPYVLRSGLLGIVAQRLLRRLCDCSQPSSDDAGRLGLPVETYRTAGGCADCRDSGYRGRMLIAEMLRPTTADLARAILAREDLATLEQRAADAGLVTLCDQAVAAVENGRTSPAEVRRLLGTSRW